MEVVTPPSSVAVIGSGIAGASCAHALASAGCAVQVVDEARGAGGRLATRRLEWLDAQGRRRMARLDHGAPPITARGALFQQSLASAGRAGLVAPWLMLAAGSRPLDVAGPIVRPGCLGLGACGDFLGGTGVEGAWLSSQALGDAIWPERCLTLPTRLRVGRAAEHPA